MSGDIIKIAVGTDQIHGGLSTSMAFIKAVYAVTGLLYFKDRSTLEEDWWLQIEDVVNWPDITIGLFEWTIIDGKVYELDSDSIEFRSDPRVHTLLSSFDLLTPTTNQLVDVPYHDDLIIGRPDVGPEYVTLKCPAWWAKPSDSLCQHINNILIKDTLNE